jgi:hypothetical protein
MCDLQNQWKSIDALNCKYVVENPGKGEFVVRGHIEGAVSQKVVYFAANPATYNASFTGSGLPFPNPEVAFEGTPNNGAVTTGADGSFEFHVFYPNSYYVALGTIYVGPHVFIKACGNDKIHTIYLGDGIPFRMLTYPSPPYTAPRVSPMFYAKGGRQHLPNRTQEQILRDSEYPQLNKMPADFWGKAIQHS